MLVLAGAQILTAQVNGERGIPAVSRSTDIEIGGIQVNVQGDNAKDAREKGWRLAQRKAWEKVGGPALSDGQLESLVSAIVIEHEQIGPRRYIARLGVIFDRGRATRYLGISGQRTSSAPLLLVPVTFTGGVEMVYEQRNPWQRAWAQFQSGGSRIAYVRPSGAGGDSLLMTYGQIGRRSRAWWRNVLDEFAASDVLIAIARLDYQYPGGPVQGTFTARYGPDSTYLDSFRMTAANSRGLDEMLAEAVIRMDNIFQQALIEGKLKPNPSLYLDGGAIDPTLQRLIQMGQLSDAQARAEREAAARERAAANRSDAGADDGDPGTTPVESTTNTITVQFATPDAGAIDATLAAVRATPGVRGVATNSTAVGGNSVMSVTYEGDISALATALRSRGFSVSMIGNSIAIRR